MTAPFMPTPKGTAVLYDGHGAQGVPFRLTGGNVDPKEAADLARAAGCGAWVGRSACGAAADDLIIGQTEVWFGAFRAIIFGGYAHVWVCPRHSGSVTTLTRDMSGSLRVSQERERKKWIALQGDRQ